MRSELPDGLPDRARPPRRVGWRAAVERVAGAIRRAQGEHGPDSVGLYLSVQLLTGDYYVANERAKGLLGTANGDTNSRLCMASTVATYRLTLGADGPPGGYEDLDLAGDVFLFDSNAADTHPILFGRRHRQGRGRHRSPPDHPADRTSRSGPLSLTGKSNASRPFAAAPPSRTSASPTRGTRSPSSPAWTSRSRPAAPWPSSASTVPGRRR